MHNVGDFDRSDFAVNAILDRDLFHAEMLSDQWREGRHRTALTAAKDGCERGGLLLIRALVDVCRKRPVAVGHWARRVGDDCGVQAVERDAVVIALIDMEDQWHIAFALGRPRRERRGL